SSPPSAGSLFPPPPTTGCSWHDAQLTALNNGPSPVAGVNTVSKTARPASKRRRCAAFRFRSAVPSDAGTTMNSGMGALVAGGAAVGAFLSQAATPMSVASSNVLRFVQSMRPSWTKSRAHAHHRSHRGMVRVIWALFGKRCLISGHQCEGHLVLLVVA